MGTLIAVGQKYPMFQGGTKQMMFQDGAILEALGDGEGLWFTIYMNQPHPEEELIIRRENINTRLYKKDGFVLPIIRFGNTILTYEMSFDPTLYEDARALDIINKNNLLTIVLVDSSNGVVKGLRQANLPLRFMQQCTEVWSKAFLQPNYSEMYAQWYRNLHMIPLETLWDVAEEVGEMGETFDLKETHYRSDSQHYKEGKE